jgi:nitric oxide reductase subunit B
MVWYYASRGEGEVVSHEIPDRDPLIGAVLSPSQKATVKYFVVVTLLFLLQIMMGMLTAHYGVEGQGFYGIPLADYLPYVVTRTWHTQLGIFWIATHGWPRGCLLRPSSVAMSRSVRSWGWTSCRRPVDRSARLDDRPMAVCHAQTPGSLWFWFGHQGYEYVDLGRVWQAALFVGLLLWLFLIARTAIPALRIKGTSKSLIILYFLSTTGIALFYSPGLFWGMRSHLSVVEYWRWWVVHLWVEGYFEVFATVVIAYLFARLGVIHAESAAQASLLSGAIYLTGGIIGTLHHLYFAGTPTVAIAFGSVFSALEIVPLLLVGYEAVANIRRSKARPWLSQYKWIVYFFVAVAFWNLVGAGIFGFMINPPIALYYMQG